MTLRLASIVTALGLTVAVPALAQTPDAKPADKPAAGAAVARKAAPPPAMEMPKPGAELAALKPWVANWKCDVELTPPGAPGSIKTKSTISGKWALGNFWLVVTYKVSKTKEFPGFEGSGLLGYDTSKKEYMFMGVDNMGGWIDLTAPTVSDTGVAWTGTANMMNKAAPMNFDWAMKDKQMTMKISMGGQLMQTDTCKK